MAWVNILQAIYPVGSVYISASSTSPASLIGGTWSQKTNGVLACAGTTGYASLGSSSGSSTITEDNIPSHHHTMHLYSTDSDEGTTIPAWQMYVGSRWNTSGSIYSAGASALSGRWGATGFGPTSDEGGGVAYYPQHYSVNVWVRTA